MFIGCCCFTLFCTFVLYFKVIYNYYLCKMCLYIIVYNIGFGYIINFILLVVIIKIYMLLFKLVCIKILNILIIILRDRRIKLCRLLLSYYLLKFVILYNFIMLLFPAYVPILRIYYWINSNLKTIINHMPNNPSCQTACKLQARICIDFNQPNFSFLVNQKIIPEYLKIKLLSCIFQLVLYTLYAMKY